MYAYVISPIVTKVSVSDLTLKVHITTAADNTYKYFFRENKT